MEIKNKNPTANAETISTTFAYILGAVCGDGNITIRVQKGHTGGDINLKVKDEDFALRFKEHLERWSCRKAKISRIKDGRFWSRLHSKFHAYVINDYNLQEIVKQNIEFKHAFIRGLFDSDGGIVGKNLDNRRRAKRWLHFSNNNLELVDLAATLLTQLGLRYSLRGRIHSGFGSRKIQYELKMYHLKDMFYFYKNIGFLIGRKQKVLKDVIKSYDCYSRETFNKAKELHKQVGYRKVAKAIGVPPGIVYGWLFKNNQKQILDTTEV